jgi:cholesterol oxidase
MTSVASTAADARGTDETAEHYDVVVVGSGFGGSVTALRLAEKGYRVAVLEAGRRFDADTLPRTSWDLRRFLWFPRLGLKGIQRISLLKDVLILSGAGVGGGSLVYANTLYRPLAPFYEDPQWAHLTDWEDELAPYYDQAERMLGVNETPFETAADAVMRTVAEEMGVADTFHSTPVGIWFGTPGERVPDPYFGGAGPDKVGCIRCGECMTGCRHGAKNSLTTNYLHLAEGLGVRVLAEHEVADLVPRSDGGYDLSVQRPGTWRRRRSGRRDLRSRVGRTRSRVIRADQVVISASALGTQKLLHRWKDEGRLPFLSDRLGDKARTNSEAIVGAASKGVDVDYSEGIAITSSFHPDEHTHIEPVRYGKGSNSLAPLTSVMVDGGGRVPRGLRYLATVLTHPMALVHSISYRRWSERSVILLVMQTIDNSIKVRRKRGLFGTRLTTEQGDGEPNPTWLPVANRAARRTAEIIGGRPWAALNESVLDIPTTAHFIGGCTIGGTPAEGVIDPYHRVFGHPGLHICDGSAISANLGVNPSLTITAMTERAASFWPNKGEADPRPPLGEGYERIDPVPPRRPAVPEGAPAELRLPTRRATAPSA